MSCACRRKTTTKFEWTDGKNVVEYDSELAAKAKVMRRGGSYKPKGGDG